MKTKKQLKAEKDALLLKLKEANEQLEEINSEEYKTKLIADAEEVKTLEKENQDLEALLKQAEEKLTKVNSEILGGSKPEPVKPEEQAKLVKEIAEKLK